MLSAIREGEQLQQHSHWSLEFPEGNREQSMRRCRMILLQDAVNVVGRIRGDQNARNRENSNQSQYNSCPPRHDTKFVASTSVPVKKDEGRGRIYSDASLRDLGDQRLLQANQSRRASNSATQARRLGGSLPARIPGRFLLPG